MSVVHHPLVTEKAMNEMDFDNKLQFIVDLDAAKPEIAEDVEEQYDVTVERSTRRTRWTAKRTRRSRL